jgi:NDP-hexose C3-ketoreductase / dTDP-4-oxo-2-deoxy-alpha-D-pentos-2-ene 2,3-reductase
MEYAKLGKSNCTVSNICLGTMHFGSKADEQESFRIMDRALEVGMNFFDTADIYGGPGAWGRSEEIIGKWLAQGGGRRDKVVLATKVYAHENWLTPDASSWPNIEPGLSAFKIKKNAEGSLRRLQTDNIDLYQVHHIDRRITGEEFWESFERLQASGHITYVGTSNFPGWALTKFQMFARQRGNLGIVSEQTMYNLFCRYPELEVLPAARDSGIGVLAYMPLGGGVLTGTQKPTKNSRTAEVETQYGLKLSENEQLEEFARLCREIGEEERNVAIAWTLAHPVVCSAIVGIRTAKHLEGILRAAELKLDEGIITRLNEIFEISRGRALANNAESPEAYAW